MSTEGTRLFIKNLLFSITEEDVSSWLEKATGSKPLEVVVLTGFKGRLRGRSFVRVRTEDEAKALALNGTDLDGRPILVELAKERVAKPEQPAGADGAAAPKPRRQRKAAAANGDAAAAPAAPKRERAPAPPRKVYDNATQLYVNNLDFAVTVDELRDFFNGKLNTTVLDVEIVTSKFGQFRDRSRGFGFVVVPNNLVDAAKNLAGSTLKERDIGVDVAKPRPAVAESASGDAAAPAASKPRRRRGPKKAAADGETAPAAAAPAAGEGAPKKKRVRKPKAAAAPATTA